MKNRIAYCGLDCQKCDAYIATVNDDLILKEKTAELWSKLNNANISSDMINCMGCKSDGIKSMYCKYLCEIRKCAKVNDYETCAQCDKLRDCDKIRSIIDNNKEVRVFIDESKN